MNSRKFKSVLRSAGADGGESTTARPARGGGGGSKRGRVGKSYK